MCIRDSLWPDDHIHRFIGGKALIKTLVAVPEKLHTEVCAHDAVENIALADKVGDKRVLRFVVDILRCANLLNVCLLYTPRCV